MSDPDKIDFRALDPSQDHERWEDRLASVMRLAARRQRELGSVPLQLLTWARPALALAAALAVFIWTGFLIHDPRTQVTRTADPAYLLAHWAISNEVPSAAEVLTVLGGDHDSR